MEILLFLAVADEGDRTEEPTPHRRREARRKGLVFKSGELNAAINILGVMFLFYLLGNAVFDAFQAMLHTTLGRIAFSPDSPAAAATVMQEAIGHVFRLTAPVLGAALFLGLASNFTQVGFLTTASTLIPRLNRLNPLEGVKRIFSRRALFELAKALCKVVIVGLVTYLFLRGRLEKMLLLINREAALTAAVFWETVWRLGLTVGMVFLALAFLDYLFQRAEHEKSLKMSLREIREEFKHLEGDPLIKSRRREKQRQIARQRMLQEVPSADVVITNPTEIAVALRYDAAEHNAPVLVAKGAGETARRIREIAAEHGVAIVENAPVARMIWQHTELEQEIPVELYQAVAEILAMIYREQERRSP